MCDTENVDDAWAEHFQWLTTELGDLLNSIELTDGENFTLTHGNTRSEEKERSLILEIINRTNNEGSTLFYSGSKYIYINKVENTSSGNPFYIFAALSSNNNEKLGLIVTTYCSYAFVATFEHEKSANAVRAIDKILSSVEE